MDPLTVFPELPPLTVITSVKSPKFAAARVKVFVPPFASPIVEKPETLVRLSVPVLAKSSVAEPLPFNAPLTVTPFTVKVLPPPAVKVDPAAIVTALNVLFPKFSIVPAPARVPPDTVPPSRNSEPVTVSVLPRARTPPRYRR